jgi:hypothetical protein
LSAEPPKAEPPVGEATPAAVHASAPPPPTRSNIWDIEEDEGQETEAMGLRQRAARRAKAAEKVLKLMEEQTRQKAQAATSGGSAPALQDGGRAKTRIIGFHAADLEPGVFDAPQSAPTAPGQFPTGWIVVVDGPGRGASFAISAGVSSIGRESDQSICLDFGDMSISRQSHALIAYDEEQNKFFIGHGGKSNLVRLNGNPVLSTEDLSGGDHIRIGKTTLRFIAFCGPDFTWGGDEDVQNATPSND